MTEKADSVGSVDDEDRILTAPTILERVREAAARLPQDSPPRAVP